MPAVLQPSLQTLPYRPEIDGLRTLSVVAVILYHFGFGLNGGFVGVDVFFVISGYLISSIILSELEDDCFRLSDFWSRRIRRILPASCLVVGATLVAGIFVLEPGALEDLAKSAIANSFMLSNLYFWGEAGYFSPAAELKPLLHTWSLAIEEQFYLLLPLGLIGLVKTRKRLLLPIVLLACFASLGLSIATLERYPGATFFFLPTRSWELLAGTILAIVPGPALSRPLRESLSFLGLLLIVVPMFLYSSSTPFPATAALPPTIGAALLIWSNHAHPTLIGKALSTRPCTLIGKMSYSLYLWHWPIVTLAHHMMFAITPIAKLALLVLTFLLSYLSWKAVEIPFRKHPLLQKNSAAFAFGISCIAILLGASLLLSRTQGLPQRFDDTVASAIADVRWTGSEFRESSIPPTGEVRFGREANGHLDYILWGDSHGMTLAPLFSSLSQEVGLTGKAVLYAARPPVAGLWMPGFSSRDKTESLKESQEVLDWILAQNAKNLILVGRWDAMCSGDQPIHISALGGKNPLRLMVSDSQERDPSSQESASALERQLRSMLKTLEREGITVWLLLQAPEARDAEVARKFMLMKRFPLLNPELPPSSTTRSEYLQRRNLSESVFRSIDSSNFHVVDPIDHFFIDGAPLLVYGDSAYYRDADHLTRTGAEKYFGPSIRKLLLNLRIDDAPSLR